MDAGPATVAIAVTPSDSTNFTSGACRALYVGTTGNITAIVGGVAVLFTAVPVGLLPVSCTRVNSTATTASTIVALY
jgi:hypothetical protein